MLKSTPLSLTHRASPPVCPTGSIIIIITGAQYVEHLENPCSSDLSKWKQARCCTCAPLPSDSFFSEASTGPLMVTAGVAQGGKPNSNEPPIGKRMRNWGVPS